MNEQITDIDSMALLASDGDGPGFYASTREFFIVSKILSQIEIFLPERCMTYVYEFVPLFMIS